MLVVYLLNEEPLYLTMAFYSLQMLRKHNQTIPVRIYFIKDNCRDSRKVGNLKDVKKRIGYISQKKFFDFCDKQNIEVVIYDDLDLKEETGYFSAQRVVFADCLKEKVLLMDADTFIFGDVGVFFEIYKDYDFVATKNSYGELKSVAINGRDVLPFNSGVVLWNNGWFHKYGEKVYDYCIGLKNKTHPMGEFVHSVSVECGGREEFACSLFVIDNDLKFTYFDASHVQKEKYQGPTKVFHTLTGRWPHFYLRFKDKLPKKSPLGLILISGRNYA